MRFDGNKALCPSTGCDTKLQNKRKPMSIHLSVLLDRKCKAMCPSNLPVCRGKHRNEKSLKEMIDIHFNILLQRSSQIRSETVWEVR